MWSDVITSVFEDVDCDTCRLECCLRRQGLLKRPQENVQEHVSSRKLQKHKCAPGNKLPIARIIEAPGLPWPAAGQRRMQAHCYAAASCGLQNLVAGQASRQPPPATAGIATKG